MCIEHFLKRILLKKTHDLKLACFADRLSEVKKTSFNDCLKKRILDGTKYKLR